MTSYNLDAIIIDINDLDDVREVNRTIGDCYWNETTKGLTSSIIFRETPQGHDFWWRYAAGGKAYDQALNDALYHLMNQLDNYLLGREYPAQNPLPAFNRGKFSMPELLTLEALASELNYQDAAAADPSKPYIKEKLELGEAILAMEYQLNCARTLWYHTAGGDQLLVTEHLRKLCALAFVSMRDYGVENREYMDEAA